jgi:hypothetical protein
MLSDDHPYLAIYLLGSALTTVLIVAKLVLHWVLAWITSANILATNLNKLQPVAPQTSVRRRAGKWLGLFLLEAALSWINVLAIAWQILSLLLRTARDALSSAPETVQRLRFPLRRNPNLAPESVWAYLLALGIRAGDLPPDEAHLSRQLDDLCSELPHFDRKAALRQLEALEVVPPSTISGVVNAGKRELA